MQAVLQLQHILLKTFTDSFGIVWNPLTFFAYYLYLLFIVLYILCPYCASHQYEVVI